MRFQGACLTVPFTVVGVSYTMKTLPINFRATAEEKAAYEQAAKDCGLSLSGWIKKQLVCPAVPNEQTSPDQVSEFATLCDHCRGWIWRNCRICRQVMPAP